MAAQDLGVALSDLVLPTGSGILFKLGTNLAAELISQTVIAMSSSTQAYYEQLRLGRTAVPSDNGDILIRLSGDQLNVYARGGNDMLISVDTSQNLQRSSAVTAEAVETQTYDGGDGLDTLAYGVDTTLTVISLPGRPRGPRLAPTGLSL